ncbi:MAG: type II secretion system F family protein [Planctomycetes bacterium]|nr:type II secretion system F family protein [Planctomycetota bacterium]
MWLVPLAAFAAMAAVAWLVVERLLGSPDRAYERLEEIRDPRKRRREELPGAKSGMSRVLEKASPTLGKALAPKKEKDVKSLKTRLSHAGFRSDAAASMFLMLKLFGLVGGGVLGGGVLLFTSAFSMMTLLKVMMLAGVLFFLPDIALWVLGKKRKQAIFLGLPDALDLMVVCVEAGLGLDQAMRKVAEEMKKSYRVIAEEFGLCNMQLQMGRPRTDVLQDLGHRNGVDDLRSLASIIIQADKFGSSIAQALRVQSDAMRTRRRQIAEEKAAKTAVKLIFPLVIFIFPGIFVVLVGPAAITMIREMFPAMQGN